MANISTDQHTLFRSDCIVSVILHFGILFVILAMKALSGFDRVPICDHSTIRDLYVNATRINRQTNRLHPGYHQLIHRSDSRQKPSIKTSIAMPIESDISIGQ